MRNLDVISPERDEKKKEHTNQSSGEREREKRTLGRVSPFLPSPGSSPVDQLDLLTPKESRFDTPVRYVTDVHTSTFIDFHARSRGGRTPFEAFRNLLPSLPRSLYLSLLLALRACASATETASATEKRKDSRGSNLFRTEGGSNRFRCALLSFFPLFFLLSFSLFSVNDYFPLYSMEMSLSLRVFPKLCGSTNFFSANSLPWNERQTWGGNQSAWSRCSGIFLCTRDVSEQKVVRQMTLGEKDF